MSYDIENPAELRGEIMRLEQIIRVGKQCEKMERERATRNAEYAEKIIRVIDEETATWKKLNGQALERMAPNEGFEVAIHALSQLTRRIAALAKNPAFVAVDKGKVGGDKTVEVHGHAEGGKLVIDEVIEREPDEALTERELRAIPGGEAEALARRFHDLYERLAPEYGYETKPETREFKPWRANGRLMVAVCGEILKGEVAPRVEDSLPMPGLLTIRLGEALGAAIERNYGKDAPDPMARAYADYVKWRDEHPTNRPPEVPHCPGDGCPGCADCLKPTNTPPETLPSQGTDS